MHTKHRRGLLLGIGAGAAAMALAIGLVTAAHAATLFSDDFSDGDTSGWSKSGGTWAVVSDGGNVAEQSNNGSELARNFAGDTSWTDYQVQARVKPVSFNGSDRLVGIALRSESATRMYRLALISSGRAELQVVNGSSITVLGSTSLSVSTGTWYTLRIQASGSSISGFVNGAQIGAGSSSAYGAGRIALVTVYAAARFDDVTVDDSSTTPPTTTPTTPGNQTASPTTPPTSNPPTNTTGLVGWGTQGGGTTGGGSAATTTVTSASALTTALSSSSAAVIRVSGTISCSGMLKVASNKTVIGNSGATIAGCGLNVASASNVIIRNLTFRDWDDDAINVQYSTRVWIDHNTLSNGYDGAVDIKRSSDYITVSWNRVFSHDKAMLLGHDDGNSSEDVGHLRVTYHHNWFDGTNQRHPRVRFGNPVHVYNNYYSSIGSYGVASTCNAGVLVEGNYFENTDDPYHLAEGDSPDGSLVARNNYFVNSGSGQTGGSVASIPYSYTMDTASNVKSIVTAGAGAGRITL